MRNTRLISAMLAMAVFALVAADAHAIYDPKHGRFLQRDPGPGVDSPARVVGLNSRAPVSSFVPRDARNTQPRIGNAGLNNQYADGMNLHQYVGNSPGKYVDPMGLRRAGGGPSVVPPQTPRTPTCLVCGPDVTQQVKDALAKVTTKFNGLDDYQKSHACAAFTSVVWDRNKNSRMWLNAWDINELHIQNWINSPPYTPSCATPPACKNTVEVDGKCFYAGSVNYVVFGRMWSLCDKYKWTGETLIWGYKGPRPWADAAGNYEASQAWYSAGYDGWPDAAGVQSPAADRPLCEPTCPVPYSGAPFTVYWGSVGNF